MDHEACRHLLDELSDYLDDEASAEMCAEIERHLTDCADCRVVVDTLRRTIQLYRALPSPVLSEAARERLYKSLDLAEFLVPKQ
jgi:anti-sigma factor RsiW